MQDRVPVLLEEGQCEFLIAVTGVMNDQAEQEAFKAKVHDLLPFRSINNPVYIYNPTRYFGVGDVLQVIGSELGMIQLVDAQLARTITDAAQKLSRQNCQCWRIYVVAHSQGTMIVKRSLNLVDEETKQHLYLIGLGGETSFDAKRDSVAFARNIANANDIVPNVLRILTPLDFFDSIDSYIDGQDLLKAHSALGSYLEYLEQTGNAESLVPQLPQ